MSRPTRAKLPELYMKVLDPKKIVKLMVIQEVTHRELAEAVWGPKASHSYLGRILRGEIKSVQPDRAARIAEYLGVGIDDLFVARLSSNTGQTAKRRSAA
ncbi:helix-turn-helix domain-containing protein [Kribbella qitaiheensis]|uniref:helix-turn-helix domain-containing protein n=1 Tax=Kribbella qitaiheensis TaxID=1544730 RepID=UPI00361A1D89